MVQRVFNFNPGPAALPLEVLQKAQEEMLNYKGTGMSIMEMSHRSKECIAMMTQTESQLKDLLDIPEGYKVLFLQGGASTQFSMIPLNFLKQDTVANYIITGSFAEKAYKEAKLLGNVHIAATSKSNNYTKIVDPEEIILSENPAYVHITSNNTMYGTQWRYFPDTNDIPLIADMSSDILSQTIDVSKFSLIYAGAQKNLGPAGVTIVIVKESMLTNIPDNIPSMQRFDLHAKKDSSYNTPPVFPIYIVGLVLEWVKNQGGLKEIEKRNIDKASLIYQIIDESDGFYRGHAEKNSRSNMNLTFRLANEELEKKFVQKATEHGLVGLAGHRDVGGIRASIYNSMPMSGGEALAQFMRSFQKNN